MLTLEGISEKGQFKHLSNLVFRSPPFREYMSYEGHLFFLNLQKLM